MYPNQTFLNICSPLRYQFLLLILQRMKGWAYRVIIYCMSICRKFIGIFHYSCCRELVTERNYTDMYIILRTSCLNTRRVFTSLLHAPQVISFQIVCFLKLGVSSRCNTCRVELGCLCSYTSQTSIACETVILVCIWICLCDTFAAIREVYGNVGQKTFNSVYCYKVPFM